MCTVTWAYAADGYTLLMNRDELHTRGPAVAPQIFDESGVRYLAPIDTDGNGSWVVVNELGVTVGLLNRYPPSYHDRGSGVYHSRGQLILELAAARTAPAVISELGERKFEDYRPFTLFALDREQAVTLVWEGVGAPNAIQPVLPLSSSSFRGAEVVRERTELFAQLQDSRELSAELLRQYHSSHDPERGAFSVCMKRPDAATKSFSEIEVNPREVSFLYHAGAPCEDAPQSVHTLGRAPEPSG